MISNEEYFLFSRDLEQFNTLFATMWSLGKPIFTKSITTAAISFDKQGHCLSFMFNPDYWEQLEHYDRLFILCHEFLHVIFNHGIRACNTKNSELANIAMDIAVNHILINSFGFIRSKLKYGESYCWTDKFFTQEISDKESFEFYFNKLNINMINVSYQFPDQHDIGIFDNEDMDEFIKDLKDMLPADWITSELKEALNNQMAGSTQGNLLITVDSTPVKPKRKWETVIKQWSKKYIEEFQDNEQWARMNRRLYTLNSDLFLPSEVEENNLMDKSKINVWFFQDTSGSCISFAKRFFTAAKSLPQNRFDIKLYCFDTKVYETDLKSGKLYGFGGTSYSIIEDYIQEHAETYPEAVFLITDGYGNFVSPKYPKRWYVFLSSNYTSYVNGFNVFPLKAFE